MKVWEPLICGSFTQQPCNPPPPKKGKKITNKSSESKSQVCAPYVQGVSAAQSGLGGGLVWSSWSQFIISSSVTSSYPLSALNMYSYRLVRGGAPLPSTSVLYFLSRVHRSPGKSKIDRKLYFTNYTLCTHTNILPSSLNHP